MNKWTQLAPVLFVRMEQRDLSFSSAATPGATLGTTRKRQVENAGIEPATATCE